MKDKKSIKFSECFDDMFLVAREMIENHGEDCFCCASREDSAMVGVFDGCGGLGSRSYNTTKGHTEAYMASRMAGGAVYDWYLANYQTSWKGADALCASLSDYIDRAYNIGTSFIARGSRIRGTMVRDFPTTAAIAVAQQEGKKVVLHVVWAGDSRVYLMNKRGLAQLTKDDVNSDDAMSNLSDDGALTNILSSDGKYELHYKTVTITEPTMVFAATDGCFGYIPSPMDFEYLILSALTKAQNPENFRKKLEEYFAEVTGDDFAFACMSFFFGSFEKMTKIFEERMTMLEQKYITPLQANRSEEHMLALWQEYRRDYERYLR